MATASLGLGVAAWVLALIVLLVEHAIAETPFYLNFAVVPLLLVAVALAITLGHVALSRLGNALGSGRAIGGLAVGYSAAVFVASTTPMIR
jgi:hypothetical protein